MYPRLTTFTAYRTSPASRSFTSRVRPSRAALAAALGGIAALVVTGQPSAHGAAPAYGAVPAQARAVAAARVPELALAERNRMLAIPLIIDRGWSYRQFTCLDRLWTRESSWNHRARNPWSGAYGIPQALPGTKMASAGSDWRTSPETQIKWGLDYVRRRYGSPCAAWGHARAKGWY